MKKAEAGFGNGPDHFSLPDQTEKSGLSGVVRPENCRSAAARQLEIQIYVQKDPSLQGRERLSEQKQAIPGKGTTKTDIQTASPCTENTPFFRAHLQ